jgi:hypothetical protein
MQTLKSSRKLLAATSAARLQSMPITLARWLRETSMKRPRVASDIENDPAGEVPAPIPNSGNPLPHHPGVPFHREAPVAGVELNRRPPAPLIPETGGIIPVGDKSGHAIDDGKPARGGREESGADSVPRLLLDLGCQRLVGVRVDKILEERAAHYGKTTN